MLIDYDKDTLNQIFL